MVERTRLPKRPNRHSRTFLTLPSVRPPRMHTPDDDADPAPLLPTSTPSSPSLSPSSSSPPSPVPGLRRELLLAAAILSIALLLLAVTGAPRLVSTLPRIAPTHPPRQRTFRNGVSIVAACTNRQPMLRSALTSWLRVAAVDEILLVDWTSEPPLRALVADVLARSDVPNPPPVRVFRVHNERAWVLSRAYNLAVRRSTRSTVFKLDCDYVLTPDAVHFHALRLDSPSFYTGFYLNARTANEMHLNGAMLVSQRHFWSVGGYDERIQTYGYDDEDLYQRLINAGLARLNISYDHVSHISHEDSRRAQQGVKFPRAQIDLNRLILEKLEQPWGPDNSPSVYKQVGNDSSHLVATYIPTDLQKLVSPEVRDEAWRIALGRRLRDDFEIPWAIISSMSTPTAEKLLGNMNTRRRETHVDEVVDRDTRPRILLLHVQSGLGNRLRALGSGLAFAKKSNREPVVVWEKDVHFGGLYSDIFNSSTAPFAVLDTFKPNWPLAAYAKVEEVWNKFVFYNYMLKDTVGQLIEDVPNKHMYFKSSAIMNSDLTSWESENERIRSLQVRDDIQALASQITKKGMYKVAGVHIRNRSLDDDIPGVEDSRNMYSKEDAELLDKWRATTKYTSFVDEMTSLLGNRTVIKFFVATDTVKVLKILDNKFPEGTIRYIPRDCDDRSAHCEKFAMADLLVLARTQPLLGSTWSSFTEAAMRLGGPKALMAGTFYALSFALALQAV